MTMTKMCIRDRIDTSKTGSITIHKYDMTAAKQRGVNLDNFTSTGKQDTAAEAALEKYAIKGVEFSYLRVGDVEQQSENGKIQMIYELPTALQQILGPVSYTHLNTIRLQQGILRQRFPCCKEILV